MPARRAGTRHLADAHDEQYVMLTHTEDIDRSAPRDRAWVHEAVRLVEADANRSADIHLTASGCAFPDVDLSLKDEPATPRDH